MVGAGGPRVYDFGPFRLDAAERLLLRDGHPVALTPKAFDLLVYLVERPGHLVEKAMLMSVLWPDTIVEEANLTFQVSALRKVLDEDRSGASIIQTVPTRGYRFVGEVTSAIAQPPPAATSAQISAEPQSAASRQWRVTPHTGVIVLLVVAAVGLLLFRPFVSSRAPAKAAPQPAARLVPLTTMLGFQSSPSLSPDGEQVAFEWGGERDDNWDIYVTLVGTTDVRRMTTNAAEEGAPSWSPSGREIAFLQRESGCQQARPLARCTARIHVMTALGGPDRRVSDFPAYGRIAWSPDARYIVSGRQSDGVAGPGIYLVPLSGAEPRALVSVRPPAVAYAPVFSPEGRLLAYLRCASIDSEENAQGCHVMVVDVDASYTPSSPPRQVTSNAMSSAAALTWTRDGRAIVFSGYVASPPGRDRGTFDDGMFHLWRVTLGRPPSTERLEMAGLDVDSPSVASRRDRLVFSRYEQNIDIYRFVRGEQPVRVLSSTYIDTHPSYSNDGRRIAFCSDRTGTLEIWTAAADGSSPRQVTRGPNTYQGSPRWSPDGSHLAFDSLGPDANRHVWTIPVDGGAATQLTFDAGEQAAPTWSHDGQWIYFTQPIPGRREVWRVRATGGSPEQISHSGSGLIAFESVDARHIVHTLRESDSPVVQTPLTGGDVRQLASCARSPWGFSLVASTIYYMACGTGRAVPIRAIDGSGHDQLWAIVPDMDPTWLRDPAISPDGTTLLYEKVVNQGANLWMIDNFR